MLKIDNKEENNIKKEDLIKLIEEQNEKIKSLEDKIENITNKIENLKNSKIKKKKKEDLIKYIKEKLINQNND